MRSQMNDVQEHTEDHLFIKQVKADYPSIMEVVQARADRKKQIARLGWSVLTAVITSTVLGAGGIILMALASAGRTGVLP